jgi:hypothetical protein
MRSLQAMDARFGQWREDGTAVLVQGAFGMFNAGYFFACNGVCGHKATQAFTQSGLCGSDHITLGGAHVHQ